MDFGVEYTAVGEIILASQGYFGGYCEPSVEDYLANFAVDVALILSALDNLGYLRSYFTLESQEGPALVHLVIAEVRDRVSITIDNYHFVHKFQCHV